MYDVLESDWKGLLSDPKDSKLDFVDRKIVIFFFIEIF
jgi:hypothetical protein